jgi:hypothetical protein
VVCRPTVPKATQPQPMDVIQQANELHQLIAIDAIRRAATM